MGRDVLMSDPHVDEPSAKTQVTGQTKVAMTSLKKSIGAAGMSALSASLDKISSSLTTSINSEARQLGEITKNSKALNSLKAKVPKVKNADVKDAINATGNALKGIVTPDTAKVQKAAAAANTQPDPTSLDGFTDGMSQFYVADSRERITSLNRSRADVEGLKQAVDEA